VGTVEALVVKVKMPDEDTLYCVTGEPLKLNENGIVSVLDQLGDELELPKIVFHPAGIPFAPPGGPGYSASVFNPPGLPGLVVFGM